MNYFDYLKTKSKLLVIWFIINGGALFVNIFEIKGRIYNNYRSGYSWNSGRHDETIYLFTSNTNPNKFWPFVEFYDGSNKLNAGYVFRGIFTNYDISEFIAYGLLIFIILYFNFESKKGNITDKKGNS